MKKLTLLLCIAVSVIATNSFAQSTTCPTIVPGTFSILTDANNPCLRRVTFDFINPTNGQKRIGIRVTVNNAVIIDECYDASGNKDVQRTYLGDAFTACNMSAVVVVVTPYSGGTCASTACAPTTTALGSPLPVMMTSFTLSRNSASVNLNWSTATEVNNAGFTIERNNNGNWVSVATVASKAINGNSTSVLNYTYADLNAAKGITQYRIKQTDIDGQVHYSDIRAIRGIDQAAKTTIFPTPSADGNVNVVYAETATRTIALVDMAGRVVKQWNNYTANSLQVTNLKSGMYQIRSLNQVTGEVSSDKIMVNIR